MTKLDKKIAKYKAIERLQLKDNLPEHAKQTNKVVKALETHLK